MDNAVSRLDNGELKQGVGFVMRRHTSFTLPHASPTPCYLPPAVAVLAKMRTRVAKQILLLFNCNQIISTRFLRPLFPPAVAIGHRRRQGALVAPNERVLNIVSPDSLPLFMWLCLCNPTPVGVAPGAEA